jgi:hypothetical protein
MTTIAVDLAYTTFQSDNVPTQGDKEFLILLPQKFMPALAVRAAAFLSQPHRQHQLLA